MSLRKNCTEEGVGNVTFGEPIAVFAEQGGILDQTIHAHCDEPLERTVGLELLEGHPFAA